METKKDCNINFRITEEKKNKLQQEANNKNITLSTCIDQIIDLHLEPQLTLEDGNSATELLCTEAVTTMELTKSLPFVILGLLCTILLIMTFQNTSKINSISEKMKV